MLAYVFWHWRRDDVPAPQYEMLQQRFHEALSEAPPEGFVQSTTAAIRAAPWANGGRDAYEDWYLVNGSASLDPLETAAITAGRKLPHDAAAAAAAGGTAGLYKLRLGAPPSGSRQHAWFAKPSGMSYEALFQAMAPLVEEGGGALWIRQMVLGPTPEICLDTVRPVRIPGAFHALAFPLRTVWPPAE